MISRIDKPKITSVEAINKINQVVDQINFLSEKIRALDILMVDIHSVLTLDPNARLDS